MIASTSTEGRMNAMEARRLETHVIEPWKRRNKKSGKLQDGTTALRTATTTIVKEQYYRSKNRPCIARVV
jgi:hypothetical protein